MDRTTDDAPHATNPDMHDPGSPWTFVALASSVPEDLRSELENLFFFNPRQTRFAEAIKSVLQRAAPPSLLSEGGRLWIGTEDGTTQCLIACDTRVVGRPPIGLLIYNRPAPDRLEIVHIAVHPDFANDAASGGPGLAALLVSRVLNIAHALCGVNRVDLAYRPGTSLRVR